MIGISNSPNPDRNARRVSRGSSRDGFTLIELVVVVVLIAIIAAMVVPKLTGTTKRTFDLTVDRVADLLVMYAQRDHLARYPVGLTYDPEFGNLGLVVLTPPPDEATAPSSWRPDVFVPDVTLPEIMDLDALTVYADGESVDVRTWPLANVPGQPRPTIEVFLRSKDGEYDATLRLSPHGVAPKRLNRTYFFAREPVDLDAVGRSQEDW